MIPADLVRVRITEPPDQDQGLPRFQATQQKTERSHFGRPLELKRHVFYIDLSDDLTFSLSVTLAYDPDANIIYYRPQQKSAASPQTD